MDSAEARKVALATWIVVFAVVAWESLQTRGVPIPHAKTLVALLVLAAGLSVAVDIAPGVVGPLTLLVGLAIVVSRFPKSSAGSKFLNLYGGTSPAPSGDHAPQSAATPPLTGGNA